MHLVLVFCWLLSARDGPPPTGPDAEPAWSVVTVLPGETIAGLAERFLVPPADLLSWNPDLSEPLRVGARIRVFASRREEERFRMRYRTRSDVSVAWLARHFDLPAPVLRELNGWSPRRTVVREGVIATVYVTRSQWPDGLLDGGIPIRDGPGLKVKHPDWSWGRPLAVRTLEGIGRRIAAAFPGTLLVVGDLSREGGGAFPPHAGHKKGLEADLCLYRRGEPWRERFTDVAPDELDAERTWFLIARLLETGRVDRIILDWHLQEVLFREAAGRGADPAALEAWFQYPRKRWEQAGLIRHGKGHRNHLHVRFVETGGEGVL